VPFAHLALIFSLERQARVSYTPALGVVGRAWGQQPYCYFVVRVSGRTIRLVTAFKGSLS